jgi:hypothetical protein
VSSSSICFSGNQDFPVQRTNATLPRSSETTLIYHFTAAENVLCERRATHP